MGCRHRRSNSRIVALLTPPTAYMSATVSWIDARTSSRAGRRVARFTVFLVATRHLQLDERLACHGERVGAQQPGERFESCDLIRGRVAPAAFRVAVLQ